MTERFVFMVKNEILMWQGAVCVCACVSGREWSDWSSELRIPGDELKWKFTSDGSVNGWGWRFTVYPIMPAAGETHQQTYDTSYGHEKLDYTE